MRRLADIMDPCAKHQCSACCHDTEMPLTEADAQRLMALGHERAAFTRILAGALTLQNVNGACFFLKDQRCSVYADRPSGCRIYPFVLDLDDKMVRDEDCPWKSEFAPNGGTKSELLRIVAVIGRERAAGERAA